jgi:hypothetical protein
MPAGAGDGVLFVAHAINFDSGGARRASEARMCEIAEVKSDMH